MSAASNLPDWIIHNLLKDVEAAGKPQATVVLLRLCHSKEAIYGAPASPTRRLVQKKWDLIKRRTLSSYKKLLDHYTVPYGAATLRHFAQPFDGDEASIDYSDGEEEDEQETPASVEQGNPTSVEQEASASVKQEASASVEQETSASLAAITSGFGDISLGNKNLT
jgi:hypothetical protein